jgi:predicted short-subunit dehydrogenase-like oxidoreductase (DUF2520 family)
VTDGLPIHVYGAGRAGVGIALALARAGRTVALHSRRFQSIDLPGITGLPDDAPRTQPGDAFVLLAVPDRAIAGVAAVLNDRWRFTEGDRVGHLSGALPSAVLADAGVPRAACFSAHPLHPFAPAESATPMPPGTFVMVEGAAEPVASAAMALFRQAGATVAPITPDRKPLCHAAAVLASNLPAALLLAATRALADAGVPDAPAAATRLASGLLANWIVNPDPRALTGPVARGDAATVKANIHALEGRPDARGVYRGLSRLLAGELHAAGVLDEEEWNAMIQVLETPTDR